MKVALHPPFYLLRSSEVCWKCHRPSDAIAFAAGAATPHDEDEEVDDISPLILQDIQEAPAPFLIAAATTGVDFRERFSQAAGHEYFMNHCECGAPFGDHYLHSEPGHAFFPLDPREAERIQVQEIEWDVDMEADCWFAGWKSLCPFEHGTRIEGPIRIPQ